MSDLAFLPKDNEMVGISAKENYKVMVKHQFELSPILNLLILGFRIYSLPHEISIKPRNIYNGYYDA